ncbi:MAG TPA: thiamine pyrophosphate-binding protein [Spirochaetes bacterium]|nr:thiamine pyrophosphate-binding protein [Spirochaetota bacterium]
MGTKLVTAGQLAADALTEMGVDQVSFVAGGHTYPVQEGLKNNGVKMLATRHEQGAVFMAEAWGRLTRKPGVAMVTAGPGFTNALTPIANARMANSPLLLISGVVGLRACEKLDLQDMVQWPVITPMVKKALVCYKAERIKEFVDMAYRACISGRPGPVYLELPIDITNTMVDPDMVKKVKTIPEARVVDLAKASALMDMIAKAERPVLIAGSGAYYSEAGEELVKLIEKTGMPIFTATQGRGVVSDTHPLCFESSLMIRPGCAGFANSNADLIVLLGNRISLYYGCGDFFCMDAKFAQVDIEPEEIGRNHFVDLPIVSDVRELARELNRLVDERKCGAALKTRFEPWIKELRAKEEPVKNLGNMAYNSDQHPIHPARLAMDINKFMNRDDDIVVGDGGDTQIWASLARTVVKPGHYLESGIYGCLGVGIPYAIAAKMLYPGKRVLNLIGDGSVGFNFMEFETAIRKKIPVVIVISNDRGWGMIRHSQKLKLGHAIEEGAEIGNIEYHKIVEAMGGKGLLVEKAEDIVPALEEAFASGKTACINVMTDPGVMSPGAMALAMVSGYKLEGL